MPRTYSSIDKIRAELAWVNETPDPNNAAAAISGAARKLATGREPALVLRNEVLDVPVGVLLPDMPRVRLVRMFSTPKPLCEAQNYAFGGVALRYV
jgi:hypothetical protein